MAIELTELSHTFVYTAANVTTSLFVVLVVVQILIGVGILPISIVWGGRQTELTPALRIASVVAAIILGGFIYIIRYRAGLVGNGSIPNVIWLGSWVVTAYMALNTVGNLASVSNTERWLFGPMTFVLTISCLIISASSVT